MCIFYLDIIAHYLFLIELFQINQIKKYEGIRVKFDEDKARLYFDKWLKSLC
jgi:hypothetical protein